MGRSQRGEAEFPAPLRVRKPMIALTLNRLGNLIKPEMEAA